uniref:RING-type domain-containing protein n=1 Tax=Chlamydomonas euryale TaxID=1486919 RepID=A0A7R9W0Y7_9CHLO|mmetsp:Transcript_9207/g.28023  ORF Transcript_9207/g.28023 Transcript_9207/m.28023 type:complete len:780 (+) Transcript_9207:149-2488(+)
MPFAVSGGTIGAVFALTSWSLGVSVRRDLQALPPPMLRDVGHHLAAYLQNSTQTEPLIRDVNVALTAVLRSELSVFLLVQWLFSTYAVAAIVTVGLFLGQLTPRESSRLTERLVKFIIFKVIFCSALIVPDIYEIALWLAWFAMIGFMRVFMGAARDRLETLNVSPSASTYAHMRALALVLLILGHDLVGAAALASSLSHMSTTKALLCAFDMAVVAVEGIKVLLHYVVHAVDHHMATREFADADANGAPAADAATAAAAAAAVPARMGWESWEGKGAVLYYTELVADVLVQAMTLAHYLHVWFLHGLSFQLIDAILFLDIRSIAMSMAKRLRGYLNYRHVTHSLRHAFPDAAPGAADDACTICMDRMLVAKQLPCGHLFHLSCLRAWLQQSGAESFACPLCRTPLLQVQPSDLLASSHAPLAAALLRVYLAVMRAASVVYLDMLVLLLLGLPLSYARSWRGGDEADNSAGGGGATVIAAAARRAAERERDRQVERIGENDHPSPADVAQALEARGRAIHGPPLPSTWRTRLWSRLFESTAPDAAAVAWAAAAAAPPESSEDFDSDAEGVSDEEAQACREAVPKTKAAGTAGAARRTAPRRRREGGLVQQQPERAGSGEAAGPSSAAGLLPLSPPPYCELETWSDTSVHAAASAVAHTIRSSLGMGVRGRGGAVAGHEPGDGDEVESPYRRSNCRPPRPRGRGPSARRGGRVRLADVPEAGCPDAGGAMSVHGAEGVLGGVPSEGASGARRPRRQALDAAPLGRGQHARRARNGSADDQ